MKNIFTRFLSKRNKHTKHALAFLNAAQFMGVLNDNLFKLFLVFLLIDKLGSSHASAILAAAGAVYVIPFLLFSYYAGVLADKWSKQRLLVFMKLGEVAIMTCTLFAFGWKNEISGYVLLALLATHSALIGPPKYGIIPELVTKDKVAKANGLITSFTYLAIILGTFLASFLTDITNHNFIIAAVFCLIIAILGYFSSTRIPYTQAQGSIKAFTPLFISEIAHTLRTHRSIPRLLLVLWSSAYFLFIGAFTQLNIIPFAIQELHLSELAGGYLFLAVALGIAGGAFIAGKLSRKQVELGVSCLASLLISLLFFLLYLNSHHLITVTTYLVFLGLAGGIFIVPLDTFIQLQSPEKSRGQVIAAGNFLGFLGVLIASFALFLLSDILSFSAGSGFGFMGLLGFFFFLILLTKLGGQTLSYIAKKVLIPLLKIRPSNLNFVKEDSFLILEKASWFHCILLLGYFPSLRFYIPKTKISTLNKLAAFFFPFHFQNFEILCENPSGTCLVIHRNIRLDNVIISNIQETTKKHSPLWKRLLHSTDTAPIHVLINRKEKVIKFYTSKA